MLHAPGYITRFLPKMTCLEAFSEEARWPAQLPKRSALPPSEAEAGTLDECPVQDNELEAHRLQDHDAGRALAADPAQAAPPTQVVNNTVTFTDPDNRVKAHLHGNGPAAATRRASVSSEADSEPPTGKNGRAPLSSLKADELNEAGGGFFFGTPGGPVVSGEGIAHWGSSQHLQPHDLPGQAKLRGYSSYVTVHF